VDADFADSVYILPYDEYAVLCYQVSPEDVPFRAYFTKGNQYGETVLGYVDDNGIGGGDCVQVPIDYDDVYGMYVVVEVYVDGVSVGSATAQANIAVS